MKESRSSYSLADLGIQPLFWDFISSHMVFGDHSLNSNIYCLPLLFPEASLFVLKCYSVPFVAEVFSFSEKGTGKKGLSRNYYSVDNPATT